MQNTNYYLNHKVKDFEEIENLLRIKNFSSQEIKSIEEVFTYASEKHKNQKRLSGEPYIVHLLTTAFYLINWNLDVNCIKAGLLHDVIEDQNVKPEELQQKFGIDVCDLVFYLTKVEAYYDENKDRIKSLNMRKILMSLSNDIRVIFIKLADRLHNLKTIEYLSSDKQIKMAKETKEIYAPLAQQVGLNDVYAEMNDLIFKILNPVEFAITQKEVATENEKKNTFIESSILNLKAILNSKNIEIVNIFGRYKSLWSIYQKSVTRLKPISEIYDLFAIRIILNNVDDCYKAIAFIHDKYNFLDNRYKDYIASPKSNMYQSLHTTILINNILVEVQIRTLEMDKIAQMGIAAHWLYKNHKEKLSSTENRLFKKLSANGDINKFEWNFLQNVVYALTPRGDIFALAKNSTALDFAYNVHTDLVLKAQFAVINGITMPVSTILNSGDIVEIKTNNQLVISADWVKKANDPSTRAFIRKHIKGSLNISNKKYLKAKSILKEFFFNHPQYKKLFKNKDFLKQSRFKNLDAFYEKIEEEELSLEKFFKELEKITFVNEEIIITNPTVEGRKILKNVFKHKKDIKFGDVTNLNYEFSKCCYPIPGEEIIGFIAKTGAIKIHSIDCHNLENLNKEKLLTEVFWTNPLQTQTKYLVKLLMKTNLNYLDSDKTVAVFKENILSSKYHLKELSVVENKGLAQFETSFLMANTSELNKFIKWAQTTKFIQEIIRI